MPIRARVHSFSEAQAMLEFGAGITCALPRAVLDESVQVGQEVSVLVVPIGGEDAGKTKLAQDLLNELLKAYNNGCEKIDS